MPDVTDVTACCSITYLVLPPQSLQDSLEVPSTLYPLTNAVICLTHTLLEQSCTWGIVPGLVNFVLHR
jgi:hypothetical protein